MSFAAFCKLIGLDLEPFQRKIASAASSPRTRTRGPLPRGQRQDRPAGRLRAVALDRASRARLLRRRQPRTGPHPLRVRRRLRPRARRLPELVDRHLELRWCPDPNRPARLHPPPSRPRRRRATPARPDLRLGRRRRAARPSQRSGLLGVADRAGEAARREADRHLIAGQGADSPLGRLRARALAHPSVKVRGAFTDARGPSLRMLEWCVPEDVPLIAAEREAGEPGLVDHDRPRWPRSRKPCPISRSAVSTPASGPNAKGTGSRPGRGRRASASPSSLLVSRSTSASTSAAAAPRATRPSSGSTRPATSAPQCSPARAESSMPVT